MTEEEDEGKLCSDRALGKRVVQGRSITVLMELKETSAAFPWDKWCFRSISPCMIYLFITVMC